MSSGDGWIGVDLDGTLAHYDYGKPFDHSIGEPIAPMVERVKRWLDEGRQVRIFTARVSDPNQATMVTRYVVLWCQEHLGRALPVTCVKDYAMIELWDDRAVQVRANTGEPVGFSTRGLE